MRVLLTGAGGYTGRGVAGELQAHGHWVRGCDVNPAMEQVDEAVTADIGDLESCRRALAGIEALVLCHMAPNPAGYVTPAMAIDVNVKGTANLYHAAVEARARRVVLISSAGVLPEGARDTRPGAGPYASGASGGAPERRLTMGFYRFTKGLQECVARWYWEAHGLPSAVLRPSWVVYDRDGCVTKYGKAVGRYDPGLIDPRDIGLAAVQALELPALALEAFNIGQDDAAFDLSAAHARLGWRPRYLFERLPR
jgi:nucleoside-diphosphate-sugar epimerase